MTVKVTDINEPPMFTSGVTTVNYDENRTDEVARYTAVDPEGGAVDWAPAGPDRGKFDIVDGSLTFKSPPDREAPTDVGGNNIYNVTVQARDQDPQNPETGERTVTVTVVNVDEPPTLDGPASVLDYAEGDTRDVATYQASDPEGIPISWSLSGPQRDDFTIDGACCGSWRRPTTKTARSTTSRSKPRMGNPPRPTRPRRYR